MLATLSPPGLLKLPLNSRGVDWFVGDIHGEDLLLAKGLKAAGFEEGRDRLIAVGDLVDRGPQSLEVVERFAETPEFYSVIGNHDYAMTPLSLRRTFNAEIVEGSHETPSSPSPRLTRVIS